MFWRRRRDEDDVDRLNRVWTVLIFVVTGIAAIVYLAVFPDAAISCVKALIDDKNIVVTSTYANRYCLGRSAFSPDTNYYYISDIFSYHSLVPWFLFYQSLGFLGPHILAQLLKRLLGSDSEFLFLYVETFTSKSDGSEFLNRIVSPPKPTVKNTVIYLLKKVLYLVNSLIQLVVTTLLFTTDRHPGSVRSSYREDLPEPPFPTHGRCEFKNMDTPTQTFQCTLHINGLYTRFYTFVFYWLLIVTIVNIASLVVWAVLLAVPRLTSERIKMYTMASPDTESESPGKIQAFVKDHLGKDYLLNLLLAQSTEREATTADLTLKFWQAYNFTSPNQLQTSQM